MAGPEVPANVVCRDPVSLVDAYPTILNCVGLPPHPDDRALPGVPLLDVAAGKARERTVFGEYHAAGAVTGAFMLRKGKFKFVYYVGLTPQLFDLDSDPAETRDLAQHGDCADVLADCEASLRRYVDPQAVDAQARHDQAARIAELGGRAAILAKGSFGHSPVPGTKPIYN
jgi:choline-sulfatase